MNLSDAGHIVRNIPEEQKLQTENPNLKTVEPQDPVSSKLNIAKNGKNAQSGIFTMEPKPEVTFHYFETVFWKLISCANK